MFGIFKCICRIVQSYDRILHLDLIPIPTTLIWTNGLDYDSFTSPLIFICNRESIENNHFVITRVMLHTFNPLNTAWTHLSLM